MKTLEEIETYLKELKENNEKAISDYSQKIKNAEETIDSTTTQLTNAETNADLETYSKAKDIIWTARHAVELYTNKKKSIEDEPLISKHEYKQLVASIKELTDNENKELEKRAVVLVTAIRDIADEANEARQHADKLLKDLQRKIYKEPVGSIPNEFGGTTWSRDEEYTRMNSVSVFYQSRIKGSYFSELAGESKTRNSSWL